MERKNNFWWFIITEQSNIMTTANRIILANYQSDVFIYREIWKLIFLSILRISRKATD